MHKKSYYVYAFAIELISSKDYKIVSFFLTTIEHLMSVINVCLVTRFRYYVEINFLRIINLTKERFHDNYALKFIVHEQKILQPIHPFIKQLLKLIENHANTI